jgi:hypothetical protein
MVGWLSGWVDGWLNFCVQQLIMICFSTINEVFALKLETVCF